MAPPRDREPTIAREARVRQCRMVRPAQMDTSRHVLEVAELAEEGARGDDAEAGPEAPDEAAEDGDDLVPKELCDDERVCAGRAGVDSPEGRR